MPAPCLRGFLLVAATWILSGCFRATVPADDWLERRCEHRAEGPVRIGVLLPLSGKFQWYGEAARSGLELGAGDDGLVELVVRDTAGDPGQTLDELEHLVNHEKVAAVVGPMFRNEALAAAARAQELGIPLIALSGVEELPSTGPYVFRNFLSRVALVNTVVGHAMDDRGLKTFAVVHPGDDYGTSYMTLFRAEVERRGGAVVKVESYAPDATDLSTPAKKLVGRFDLEKREDFIRERTKIKRRHKDDPLKQKHALERLVKGLEPIVDFEAVFVPDVYEKVALFAPALAAEDVGLRTDSPRVHERMRKALGRGDIDLVHLFGTEAWNHEKLVKWAGRHLQGAVFADGFFLRSRREATRAFVSAYRERFDKAPELIAAHAFDSVRILRSVLTRTPPCCAADLRDALQRVEGFDGATGRTSFDEEGDATKDVFLLEIRGEAIVEVERPDGAS